MCATSDAINIQGGTLTWVAWAFNAPWYVDGGLSVTKNHHVNMWFDPFNARNRYKFNQVIAFQLPK